ncbi:PREDICTED: VIP peptides-like, partial [Cariama cristata]|uniref:VIP peptides-like n=1 Tax=Cariama cristata TaxID=54380 RepID=UPI0005204C54
MAEAQLGGRISRRAETYLTELLHVVSFSDRLGNRMPFDGASEPDHTRGSLKSESDILQNTLPENEKFYFDLSRIIDRNARHADGIFTSVCSHLLAKLAVKRYLHSHIRKRVSFQDSPVKRHSDAVFTDNYSRFRKQMAVKKYLNSVLTGKRRYRKKANTYCFHTCM